jgi:small-conductance mechanosensitive channel
MSILSRLLLPKLSKVSELTRTEIDNAVFDVLGSLNWFFYLVLSLQLSLFFFEISPFLQKRLNQILMIFLTFYATKIIVQLIDHAFSRFIDKKEEQHEQVDRSVLIILKNALQIIVWTFAIILILENLGYSISTLIGGLGIAGIVAAFGVQSLLEDVLSYISISFDKPFTVDDYIVIGDDSGTVKKIGLRSTRIQTLSGEQLIISNRELIKSRIRNYRRIKKRRDTIELKLNLDTPVDKLKKIPQGLEKIVNSVQNTEFSYVYFKKIQDDAFLFSTTYYVLSSEYDEFIQAKQTIHLKIIQYLRDEGIELAQPTQKLYIKKT